MESPKYTLREVFSPGDQIFTRTGVQFTVEEIEIERVRIRLSSDRILLLRYNRIEAVIDNFEEIRASSNLEHAVNEVLKRIGSPDYTNEPYLYGLAQEFLKRIAAKNQLADETLPEEVSGNVIEGAKMSILINAYERDPRARQRCIQKWGVKCVGCHFDFVSTYGDWGTGFIHVHHLIPLSEIGGEYLLNPEEDMRPVCPNCHAMIHRNRSGALSIEELRSLLTTARSV